MSIKIVSRSESWEFVEACKRASEKLKNQPGFQKTLPTRRQYRKWLRHEGTAYQFGRED